MKVSFSSILRDHFQTLRNADNAKTNIFDLCIFYVFPIMSGVYFYYYNLHFERDVYSVFITFFGIFIALLLNLQVAIFAIFQRKWPETGDERLNEIQSERLRERRKLLAELNANISYLTLFSCLCLILVLFFHVKQMFHGWPSALAAALVFHFILTLLMIIKRSHALFQKEYRDSPE